MTILTNSAEGGSNGTAVTGGPGNSGGASGDAFDSVTVSGAGATLTFDNAQAAHGALSVKRFFPAAVATVAETVWTTSMGTQTQVWFRFYLYHTANPTAALTRLWQCHGGTGQASLRMTSGGLLRALDASGGTVFTFTNTVPLSAWYRVEGTIVSSATAGSIEVKLFTSMDSATALETQASGTAVNTGTGWTTYVFGEHSGATETSAWTIWYDDLGLSSTGYLGPAVTGTDTSPAYATSYDTTAVAGTGTWTNPANAESGPADSSFATWTAP